MKETITKLDVFVMPIDHSQQIKKKEQLWNKIIYEIIVVLKKSCLKLSHIPYLLIEPFDIFQEA